MMSFLWGVIGAVLVIVLFGCGVAVGWKIQTMQHKEAVRQEQKAKSEEELKAAREEREAFDQLMSYSPEQAYKLDGTDERG